MSTFERCTPPRLMAFALVVAFCGFRGMTDVLPDTHRQQHPALKEELRSLVFDMGLSFEEKVTALMEKPEEAADLMREVLHERVWPANLPELFMEVSQQDATMAMIDYLNSARITVNNAARVTAIIEAFGKYPSEETEAVLRSLFDHGVLNTSIHAAGIMALSDAEDVARDAAQFVRILHQPLLERHYHPSVMTVASALARASFDERLTEQAIYYLQPALNVPEAALSGFADAMAADRLSESQKARVFEGICEAMRAHVEDTAFGISFIFAAVQLALHNDDTGPEILESMAYILAEYYRMEEVALQRERERESPDASYYEASLRRIQEHQALLQERLKELAAD